MSRALRETLVRPHRVTLQLPGADAILLEVMATKLGKSCEDVVGVALRLLFEACAETVTVAAP